MPAYKLSSPFLKKASFSKPEKLDIFPFNMPLFSNGLEIEFTKPITFLVGENGSGKSTILEAIASKCGFSLTGGNKNHLLDESENQTTLSQVIKLFWLPKVTKGFFMRAESFFNFASYIEDLAKDDPLILNAYGGKSLHSRSHGESFMALFNYQFVQRGIYLLDEPEAALSPSGQLAFLSLLSKLEKTHNYQFIIATHSPILLSYPGAEILNFGKTRIDKIEYFETEAYKLTKSFLEFPQRYFKYLFN